MGTLGGIADAKCVKNKPHQNLINTSLIFKKRVHGAGKVRAPRNVYKEQWHTKHAQ